MDHAIINVLVKHIEKWTNALSPFHSEVCYIRLYILYKLYKAVKALIYFRQVLIVDGKCCYIYVCSGLPIIVSDEPLSVYITRKHVCPFDLFILQKSITIMYNGNMNTIKTTWVVKQKERAYMWWKNKNPIVNSIRYLDQFIIFLSSLFTIVCHNW